MAAEPLFLREGGTRYLRCADHAKGYPQGLVRMACGRCGGAGRSDKWAATGYTCYDCGGSGSRGERAFRLYTAAELAKLNAVRAKKAASKLAKKQAAYAKVQAERASLAAARAQMLLHDPVAKRLKAFAGKNEFIAELSAKLARYDLSDAQRDAALAACDRIEAREAACKASTWIGHKGERLEISGTVERVHAYEGADFYGRPITKEIVSIRTDAGAALTWFTAHSGLRVGQLVAGKATVKEHTEYRGERQTAVLRVNVKAKENA